jgi:hypothetical protein
MTRYTHTIIKTCSRWLGYRKRNAAPRMTDKRELEEWGEGNRREKGSNYTFVCTPD